VKRAALALSLLFVALTAPPSSADHKLSLRVEIRETGYIGLHVHARAGVELSVGETSELGTSSTTLVVDDTDESFRRFARWRCDERERTFVVSQPAADGTLLTAQATARTPSCARRLQLVGPRLARAGSRPALRIRDRWRIGGLAARFCVRGPGTGEVCRGVRAGRTARGLRFAALRPGLYRLSLRTPYGQVRRTLRARPRGGRLRILATGDSMIQIIDSFLKARAGGRARVRSDAHISTGLSKPSALDWQVQARRQAARLPDVVVMFIGANDGFPMAGADCCGSRWVAEYARRARRMMRVYARGGRARVLWLLLPAPRGGLFRETFPAVNSALRRAARGLEEDVRLIDLAEVFTPGGRYRDSIQIGGKTVRVRQGDGVHLNTTGASIAANIVLRVLRAERILR
jgi:lysophospholipase L1-like esterase